MQRQLHELQEAKAAAVDTAAHSQEQALRMQRQLHELQEAEAAAVASAAEACALEAVADAAKEDIAEAAMVREFAARAAEAKLSEEFSAVCTTHDQFREMEAVRQAAAAERAAVAEVRAMELASEVDALREMVSDGAELLERSEAAKSEAMASEKQKASARLQAIEQNWRLELAGTAAAADAWRHKCEELRTAQGGWEAEFEAAALAVRENAGRCESSLQRSGEEVMQWRQRFAELEEAHEASGVARDEAFQEVLAEVEGLQQQNRRLCEECQTLRAQVSDQLAAADFVGESLEFAQAQCASAEARCAVAEGRRRAGGKVASSSPAKEPRVEASVTVPAVALPLGASPTGLPCCGPPPARPPPRKPSLPDRSSSSWPWSPSSNGGRSENVLHRASDTDSSSGSNCGPDAGFEGQAGASAAAVCGVGFGSVAGVGYRDGDFASDCEGELLFSTTPSSRSRISSGSQGTGGLSDRGDAWSCPPSPPASPLASPHSANELFSPRAASASLAVAPTQCDFGRGDGGVVSAVAMESMSGAWATPRSLDSKLSDIKSNAQGQVAVVSTPSRVRSPTSLLNRRRQQQHVLPRPFL